MKIDDNKPFDSNAQQESTHDDALFFLEELKNQHQKEKDRFEKIIKDQESNILYLRSDIENMRRNSVKDIQHAVNRQLIKVINSFLIVFDDYQRSIEYIEKSNQTDILPGLMITFNSFVKALHELEVIEIETNGFFNPELHEALTTMVDTSKESNTIAQVVQKGFMYKNQVLRPAKVIIVS
jgi:molecular chaperone GrpE